MERYLLIDGGGTKLAALMIDEELNVMARARTGGVNPNSRDHDECQNNLDKCFGALFERECPDHIDAVYHSFGGDVLDFRASLSAHTRVDNLIPLSEPVAGLLAGAQRKSGLLALSGTGSDVFLVGEDGRRGDVIGGWGALLGDQGSGAWIGKRALEESVRSCDGWGEKTLLADLIRQDRGFRDLHELVPCVYRRTGVAGIYASFTPLVGRAARLGDAVALSILEEAGRLLAAQMTALMRRNDLSGYPREVVICGGAWRAHPAMARAFAAEIDRAFPGYAVIRPRFQMLLAGAADMLLKRGVSPDEIRLRMERAFPDDLIEWED